MAPLSWLLGPTTQQMYGPLILEQRAETTKWTHKKHNCISALFLLTAVGLQCLSSAKVKNGCAYNFIPFLRLLSFTQLIN
jgi:hypothetical protein